MTSLGARFEAARDLLKLTRAELAHESGYSVEQIRRVEKDLSEPGAGLLAAMLRLGADVHAVLRDGAPDKRSVREMHSGLPYLANAEEIAAARYREQIRAEARDHARMKNDRRKRVLTDEEADLLDAFRDLSAKDRAAMLATVTGGEFKQAAATTITVSGGKGQRIAGRDFIAGKKD